MTIDRQELAELLEAYALDLLDEATRGEVERALHLHPDLRDRAASMQQTLSLLAESEEAAAPDDLRSTMLVAAADRRPPGRADGDPPAADALQCYRETADELSTLLEALTDDDFGAETIYGSTVAELLAHLCAVEAYTQAALEGRPFAGDLPDGHRALTDPLVDRRDRSELIGRWRGGRDGLVAVAERLSSDQLGAEVSFHDTMLRVDQLLVARAFELWTHGDDIARAVGRPDRAPGPAVLRTMADTVAELLSGILSGGRGGSGSGDGGQAQGSTSLRLTLTGPGGGSWMLGLGPGSVDELADADATLVADVVDFCHLAADRIRPPQSLAAVRLGNDALLDALLAVTPMLAEYGDRRPDR